MVSQPDAMPSAWSRSSTAVGTPASTDTTRRKSDVPRVAATSCAPGARAVTDTGETPRGWLSTVTSSPAGSVVIASVPAARSFVLTARHSAWLMWI